MLPVQAGGNRFRGFHPSRCNRRWNRRAGAPAAKTKRGWIAFLGTGHRRSRQSYDDALDPGEQEGGDGQGRERFGGTIVHPQDWPDDLDHTDRRVVVTAYDAEGAVCSSETSIDVAAGLVTPVRGLSLDCASPASRAA